MKKIKNYDIAILLFSLLVFSLGIGWIYSKSSTSNDKKASKTKQDKTSQKKEEQPIKTTVKVAPKAPEPPKEIIFKKSDIPKKEKLLTIAEMMDYIQEWASESGVPKIITFLKSVCPKDKLIEMVNEIIKKHAQELTRKNKIKLILSLANFYTKDKNIQNKLFEIISQDETVEQGDTPLVFIAVQLEEIEVIPDMINWYKANVKRRPDLEKRTFEYAAKRDYVKALKKLQEKLPIIDKAYATKLLWILIQSNSGKKSIEFLKNLGADVNYQDPKTKFTILIQAIKNKNLAVVKELVRLGVDVTKPSDNKAVGYPVQNARELELTDIEMFLRSAGAKD